MTTPGVQARKGHGAGEESITEWVGAHQRWLTWAVFAVALIGAAFWFYQRSQSIKSRRAETAYFQARQALEAGNTPLGIADLKKVVTRYEGTVSGTQAAFTLAQAYYDQGKYKDGVAVLKQAEGKAPADFRASLHVLEAAGYEGLSDFSNAAEQFRLAAQTTRFPADKAEYQASAARDYQAAGKVSEAIAIWKQLLQDENPAVAAEARVRLGELVAKPMSA